MKNILLSTISDQNQISDGYIANAAVTKNFLSIISNNEINFLVGSRINCLSKNRKSLETAINCLKSMLNETCEIKFCINKEILDEITQTNEKNANYYYLWIVYKVDSKVDKHLNKIPEEKKNPSIIELKKAIIIEIVNIFHRILKFEEFVKTIKFSELTFVVAPEYPEKKFYKINENSFNTDTLVGNVLKLGEILYKQNQALEGLD
jgi:hypothetical protein